ncbi:MAG: hypothetical protein ACYTG5_15190 [Planctomycetota bacterium]
MNIGQIHGTGGLGKGPDRPQSSKDGGRVDGQGSVQDSALISENSREALREMEGISNRLHDDASAREGVVAEVKQRLESGYLDTAEVYRDVARSILAED